MQPLNGVFGRLLMVSVGFVFFLSAALFGSSASADVVLVEEGEVRAVIVLPEEALEGERKAADELSEHIRLMSGAELPVITDGEDIEGRTPILIGAAADDALADKVMQRQADERPHWDIGYRLEQGGDTFAFALWVEEGAVQLRGGMGHKGTRTAAYELLEQLGVRWYMPGKYGRIIPESDSVILKKQQSIEIPTFARRSTTRRATGDENYDARARLGGLGSVPGRHGFPKPDGKGHRDVRSENPEYYALQKDGERGGRQLCVSNPDVINMVAEAIRQRLDAQVPPSIPAGLLTQVHMTEAAHACARIAGHSMRRKKLLHHSAYPPGLQRRIVTYGLSIGFSKSLKTSILTCV